MEYYTLKGKQGLLRENIIQSCQEENSQCNDQGVFCQKMHGLWAYKCFEVIEIDSYRKKQEKESKTKAKKHKGHPATQCGLKTQSQKETGKGQNQGYFSKGVHLPPPVKLNKSFSDETQ